MDLFDVRNIDYNTLHLANKLQEFCADHQACY